MSTRFAALVAALLVLVLSIAPSTPANAACGDETGVVERPCGSSVAGPTDVGSAPAPLQPTAVLGNPINLITGNKYQVESDFETLDTDLAFLRHYNSTNVDYDAGLGRGWSGTFDTRLYRSGSVDAVRGYDIVQSNGRRIRFRRAEVASDGRVTWHAALASDGRIVPDDDDRTAHRWQLADGRTMSFRGSFLVALDRPGHRSLSLFYRHRQLSTVTDETGRVLRFGWTPGRTTLPSYERIDFTALPGHLATLELPDGRVVHYDYDSIGNLIRVRYPDGTSRRYHYENPVWPNHLTGVTDRTNVRFATWSYDEQGRATSSEHADGVERVELTYRPPKSDKGIGTTLVTNALGETATYTWESDPELGIARLLASDGVRCATCPVTGHRYRYTADGRLAEDRGADGRALIYTYDDDGRLVALNERMDDGQKKLLLRQSFEATVHGRRWPQPTRIIRPSVNRAGKHVSEIEYDRSGLPLRITDRGFAPAPNDSGAWSLRSLSGGDFSTSLAYREIERTTRFVYTDGLLTAIDGPRDDVDDIIRFEHDDLRRLAGLHLPGGRLLAIAARDALGRPSEIRMNSGSPYLVEYLGGAGAGRNQITRIEHRGHAETFGFDAEGRAISRTNRFGRSASYRRDPAGRIVEHVDDIGRITRHLLDAESRSLGQSRIDVDGRLIESLAYALDRHGDIVSMTRKLAVPSTDRTAVRTVITDHDAMIDSGTLAAVSPSSTDSEGITKPGADFDAKGDTVSVTDARGNMTWIHRDDFGRIALEQGSDTGTVRYVHDAAGNRRSRIDGNGIELTYRWDAANRLVELGEPDHPETKTRFAYDTDTGRPTLAENAHTRERFEYDEEGDLVMHTRELAIDTGSPVVLTTRYTRDVHGRIGRKTLPDGQVLRHHYHEDGTARGTLRAITRESLFGLRQSVLVAGIDLDPRDGSSGYRSHNGRRTEFRHAPNGSVESVDIGSAGRLAYVYDETGRIIGIDGFGATRRYAYDRGHLAFADTGRTTHRYAHDAVGNRVLRVSEYADGRRERERLVYPEHGDGNRLKSRVDLDSGSEIVYDYDANGSPERIGQSRRFRYDALGRPIRIHHGKALVAEYRYGPYGQRVGKTVHATDASPRTVHYLYDEGMLSGEVNGDGDVTAQYLYLDGYRAVVKLEGQDAYALHGDHLGTPRLMTDADGRIVWQAEHDPFGETTISTETVSLNLRFPGQYADAETGTHYNYFRDYDPATGRYLTSDPIGLAGGINTYGYVGADPLGFFDLLGLQAVPVTPPLPPPTTTVPTIGTVPVSGPAANAPRLPPLAISRLQTLIRGARSGSPYALAALASFTSGLAIGYVTDNYILGSRDVDRLVSEIKRYDDGFEPASRSHDWSNVRNLSDTLRREQIDYYEFQIAVCDRNYDAVLFQDTADALGPDYLYGRSTLANDDSHRHLFGSPEDFRRAQTAYRAYRASGGTRSFIDWLTHDYWRVDGSAGAGAASGGSSGSGDRAPDGSDDIPNEENEDETSSGRTPVIYEGEPTDHERLVAEEYADRGHTVVVRGENTAGPDLLLDGKYWDVKQLKSTNKRGLQSSLNSAKNNFSATGVENELGLRRTDTRAIIDARGNAVWGDPETVLRELNRLQANGDISKIKQIQIITDSGVIRWP